jgi:glycosyltransferase involved in cell wall biosynthesis
VKFLNERFPRLRVHQAEHAPNRAFFQVKRRPKANPVQFISVGGLGFRKGTDLLFEALARLGQESPFTLTIISDPAPDYVSKLESKVPAWLWKRTTFKHHLLPQDVAGELETPTLLLLPTRADTSPNAVKEAVVAGVPVVASRIGGIPDYVFPGKNGLLFAPGDLAEFVKAIKEACAHPLFRRGEVEPASLAGARDYLSPERMARNFLAAYKISTGIAASA